VARCGRAGVDVVAAGLIVAMRGCYLPESQVGPWEISTFMGTSSFIAPIISSSIHSAWRSAWRLGSSKTSSSWIWRISFRGRASASIFRWIFIIAILMRSAAEP